MNFTNENQIDWNDPRINSRNMSRPLPKLEPKVDELVSKIVGFKVYQLDPRLIKLVVKWKKGKSADSMGPDTFLENPAFIKELKEVLSGNI